MNLCTEANEGREEKRELMRRRVGCDFGGNLEESVARGCAEGLSAVAHGVEEQRHEVRVPCVRCEVDDDRVLNPPSLVLVSGIRPGVQQCREGLGSKPTQSFNGYEAGFEQVRQFRNHYVCIGPKRAECEDCRVRSLYLGHNPEESVYRIYCAVGYARKLSWPSRRVVCRPAVEKRESVCTDCADRIRSFAVIRAIHGLGLVSDDPEGKWLTFVCGLSGVDEEVCKTRACSKQQEQAHYLRPRPHAPVWSDGVE